MIILRNISSGELIKRLKVLGYGITRQSGSHIRLTNTKNGTHHITIPNHDPLRIGTITSILNDVATHFGKTKAELISSLF